MPRMADVILELTRIYSVIRKENLVGLSVNHIHIAFGGRTGRSSMKNFMVVRVEGDASGAAGWARFITGVTSV